MATKHGYVGQSSLGALFIIDGAQNLSQAVSIMAETLKESGWYVNLEPTGFSMTASRMNRETNNMVEIKVEILYATIVDA